MSRWAAVFALALLGIGTLAGPIWAEPQPVGEGSSAPVERFLRPDGTLDLQSGFKGSLSTKGWRLSADPVSGPRFTRDEAQLGGGLGTSGVPEDIHWDDRFGVGADSVVHAIAVDGQGNIYIGGEFSVAGGTPANYVAKWDGSRRSALGSGMNDPVLALVVDAVGNVYAGGEE